VREQLFKTLLDVQAGERSASTAANVSDYATSTVQPLMDGQTALGNASDLVGDACGFRVRPYISWGSPSTTVAK
jgi:hypothetical protein